jgi:hypothetical protein
MQRPAALSLAFVTGVLLLLNGSALSQLGPPECRGCENEGEGTPTYGADAYCPKTGTRGMGKGFTQQEAIGYAIRDCVNRGGFRPCCQPERVYELR